jgi:hypothetical protein
MSIPNALKEVFELKDGCVRSRATPLRARIHAEQQRSDTQARRPGGRRAHHQKDQWMLATLRRMIQRRGKYIGKDAANVRRSRLGRK